MAPSIDDYMSIRSAGAGVRVRSHACVDGTIRNDGHQWCHLVGPSGSKPRHVSLGGRSGTWLVSLVARSVGNQPEEERNRIS